MLFIFCYIVTATPLDAAEPCLYAAPMRLFSRLPCLLYALFCVYARYAESTLIIGDADEHAGMPRCVRRLPRAYFRRFARLSLHVISSPFLRHADIRHVIRFRFHYASLMPPLPF